MTTPTYLYFYGSSCIIKFPKETTNTKNLIYLDKMLEMKIENFAYMLNIISLVANISLNSTDNLKHCKISKSVNRRKN
jgi:hypothetical protein